MNLKILKPYESGKGILIEQDAGYISPTTEHNKYIMESKNFLDHSKPFEFYAVLQKYDTPNRNGRVYPERILKRESENYKKMIDKGVSLSELNHPESSLIDLDRVSHIITDVWWDGNILMGKLKKVGERNEVQDDFELICFDLVSSPSTPGAYLFLNPDERGNFEENIEEEKKFREESEPSTNKSLDLMKKLNDYLGNR